MILKSLFIAFSMYSIIPMPRVEWTDKAMKYALCFFPLVGAVIGMVIYFANRLMIYADMGKIFYCAVMTCIPIIITGGIHFDGFLDTVDAISSFADRKKRLEILKDPNCGAFAVIWGIVYFIINIALWSEIKNGIFVISMGYMLSRTLSGLSIAVFPKARKDGLAHTFSKSADKRIIFIMTFLFFAETVIMLAFSTICGLLALSGVLSAFLIHIFNCKNNFGGITGDLAGFFLQLSELLILTAVMIANKIGGICI